MTHLRETCTVARVATEHPETLPVFESHEIDYCCGGDATIEAACAGREDIDARRLLSELEQAIAARDASAPQSADPRALSTRDLIIRIVHEHHAYVRRAAPELRIFMRKVAAAHGAHDRRLFAIARRGVALLETLLAHLDSEESSLFPALMRAAAGGSDEAIRLELASMLAEHEAVGAALHEIRALTGGYTVPEWGCPTYRALFAKLREFEADLHRHVHLENNVLMPRFVRGRGDEGKP